MHLKAAVRALVVCASLPVIALPLIAQTSKPVNTVSSTVNPPAAPDVKELLESKVKAEWEAFKRHDKKAYSDLLADDFLAIEDDGQGTRNKYAAASEVDSSAVNDFSLFALKVMPLAPDAAFVTYEVTQQFLLKSQMRLKRVFVSELWVKRGGEWKARHYQETPVR